MVWRRPPPVTHICHSIIVYYVNQSIIVHLLCISNYLAKDFKLYIKNMVQNHLKDWPSSSSSDSEEWVIRVGRPAFGRRWLEASYSFPHQASPETHPAETNRHCLLRELCAHQWDSDTMWRWGRGGWWEWRSERIVRDFFLYCWLQDSSEVFQWSMKRSHNRSAILVTHNNQSTRQILSKTLYTGRCWRAPSSMCSARPTLITSSAFLSHRWVSAVSLSGGERFCSQFWEKVNSFSSELEHQPQRLPWAWTANNLPRKLQQIPMRDHCEQC